MFLKYKIHIFGIAFILFSETVNWKRTVVKMIEFLISHGSQFKTMFILTCFQSNLDLSPDKKVVPFKN